MTIRSEGQFNSVVYDEEDYYRGQERRDIVLMNAGDISRLGLRVDQRVRITSATGEMRMVLVREFDIREGNVAMYYPEANELVSDEVDPLSKTPGFKSALVTIAPEATFEATRFRDLAAQRE
jgi:anaerobic selenocysteine-containing dehydrogenase